jgi:hypothetical protein
VTKAVDDAVDVPPAAAATPDAGAPKAATRRRAVKAAEDVIAPADEAPKTPSRRRAVKAPEAA